MVTKLKKKKIYKDLNKDYRSSVFSESILKFQYKFII